MLSTDKGAEPRNLTARQSRKTLSFRSARCSLLETVDLLLRCATGEPSALEDSRDLPGEPPSQR